MTTRTLVVRSHLPRRELRRELGKLQDVLVGRATDRLGIRGVFLANYTREMFKQIHRAFRQKSAGGSDELGDRWKPLKPETIARRPITRGQRTKLGLKSRSGGRGLLTKKEDRLWRGVFWHNFSRLRADLGEGAAKAKAAQIAWGVLKARGAKTRIGTLGARRVPILIEGGRLEKSLRPGRVSGVLYQRPTTDQVFRLKRGEVSLGSAVEYSEKQHRTRRLWPSIRKMQPWFQRANDVATLAVGRFLQTRL